MKPRLNLATAPLENQRRFVAVAIGVGLPAVVIFVMLTAAIHSDWRSTRQRRAEAARLSSDLRDYRIRRAELERFFAEPESKQVMERAAFLNALIEQRSFPWTKLFMDLERELPAGVHVLSLSPRMRSGNVEVHMIVGAASDLGKLEFLRTLENSAEFTGLIVVSESRPAHQEDPTDTVKLELVAQFAAAAVAGKDKHPPAAKSGQSPSEKPASLPRAHSADKPAADAAAKLVAVQPDANAEVKRGAHRGPNRGAKQ